MEQYSSYEKGAIHHDLYREGGWYKELADKCVDFVKGRCLDLGCGDGLVSKLIDRKGYEIFGVENNLDAVHIAMQYAKIYYFDIELFGHEHHSYDYMVCLNVIEHLEKPEHVVRIFKDYIKVGAIIITDEKRKNIGRSHYQEYNMNELKELFKGYKIKELKFKSRFIGIEVYK